MKIKGGPIDIARKWARQHIQTETAAPKPIASFHAGNFPIGPRSAKQAASTPPSGAKETENSRLAWLVAKYAAYGAGAACVYDKTANDFFLSTTSLHDGKGGFTSNDRLNKANEEARSYFTRYRESSVEERQLNNRSFNPFRTCGHGQFATMTDYRAATKVHLTETMDTNEARQSLITNITCLKGHLVNEAALAKYQPSHRPKDFDLTRSNHYHKKSKYALTGVPNEATGASGYTSRSITQPFVNKGYQHFKDATEAKGLSLKDCVEALEIALAKHEKFNAEAQFRAGQAILNFRQVYAAEAHWGHAEKIVMQTLMDQGLLLKTETEKLDASLMFEDPSKSVFKRNTSVMGPLLHKLQSHLDEFRWRNDPKALADLRPMAAAKNMENLAIAHFKLNEQGNGFEDCSGLGDSFTSANATACINHARLMSGEARLSQADVAVLVACLNAVYDDASSVRHTLHEIARGCFAGAGYTIEDADKFYEGVCKKAAEKFYGGKNSSKH